MRKDSTAYCCKECGLNGLKPPRQQAQGLVQRQMGKENERLKNPTSYILIYSGQKKERRGKGSHSGRGEEKKEKETVERSQERKGRLQAVM